MTPRTLPFRHLKLISSTKYPDIQTASQRLASLSSDLTDHTARLQLEGISPLTDSLIQAIAQDLDDRTSETMSWLKDTLTTPVDLPDTLVGLE
ncbi:hypothetical protein ACFWIG_09030, partial [Corynebacterium bovis]